MHPFRRNKGPQRGALLSWRIGRQPINAYRDDADASGATVVDAAHFFNREMRATFHI
jgi:hypothetical protein